MDNKIFCNLSEREIDTIGGGYQLDDQSMGVTLTNKRIYYSMGQEKKVVSANDVLCTGFQKHNPIKYIVYAVIALILGFVSKNLLGNIGVVFGNIGVVIGVIGFVFFLIIYFATRKSIFLIEYAGGKIEFIVKRAQSDKLRTFAYNIHLEKDKL